MARVLQIFFSPLLFLFSCSVNQETANDVGKDSPAPGTISVLIDSQRDTIPTGEPVLVSRHQKRLIPVKRPKDIPLVGTPRAMPAHSYIHQVSDPKIVLAPGGLPLITPGKNGVPLPDSFPTQISVLPAIHSKPIVAGTPRMRENSVTNIQYLGVEEGLVDYYVYSILEDSRGNLWFGSNDGSLTRYDGRNLVVFQNPKTLPHHAHTSRSLIEDNGGNIWFGTETGIGRYDGNNFTYYSDAIGSKCGGVTRLLLDSKGNIWFGTNAGGIVQFDGHHFIHYNTDHGILDNSVNVLEGDNERNIWIGTRGGLNRFDGQSFIGYTTKEGMSANHVNALFDDGKGKLWIGTQGGGIACLERNTFSHYDMNLRNNTVNAILEDRRGALWFCAPDKTLNRFDGKTITQYVEENGTNSSNGNTLIQDSYGNLWFGTNEGLHKVGVNQFINFNEELDFLDIATISEDSQGRVLFGAYGKSASGLITLDDNVFLHFSGKNGDFLNSGVYAIHEDGLRNLWVGTEGDGVVKIGDRYATQYRTGDELIDNIYAALPDSLGNLWLGTLDGVVQFDGSSFTAYRPACSTGDNIVHSLVQGNNSDIWFGHHQYLGRFDGTSFSYYTTAEGLPDNEINTLFKDANGHLWIGTNEGLSHYDGQSFSNYTQEDGLVNNRIYTVTEDREHNIWVGTQNGLSVLTRSVSNDDQSHEAQPHGYKIFNFAKQDGLKQADFLYQSSFLDSKNRIWWGKTKGAMMLDLNHFRLPITPPRVHLDHIEFAQQYVDLRMLSDSTYRESYSFGELLRNSFDTVAAFYDYPEGLTLPYTLNHLIFNFTGIDWASPHALRYRYRLKGLDEGWSLPQMESRAEYRNLPHGDFTLQVMAIGSSQTWSETFEYAFTIRPPWWHTWWAYSSYGLLAICSLFILGRYQRRRLLERERQRTMAKELAQAKEIEKAYHDLKAVQSQLIQSEKMASLGELTAGIAHEIQNPLNFVNNFSEVNEELLSELKGELSKGKMDDAIALANDAIENQKKINHHGKRADAIVKNMLQHSRTSSGTKEPTDINALCDEYLRLSYHGLRAKDKSFNAKFETNFDSTLGKINVIPQDIGRVILNLINNAFYAVAEKEKKLGHENYEPTVTVTTKKLNARPDDPAEDLVGRARPDDPFLDTGKIQIIIRDNGNGIPDSVKDKIFQPFFTTKPTGQGTGLGLSLSYDIVKVHGGEIKVATIQGGGTDFVINLPDGKGF